MSWDSTNARDLDEHWMRHALAQANRAAEHDEVPVGAVVILDDKIVGEGHNRPLGAHDPTAHAEIVALRDAASRLQNYRLGGTTLYVTLEPCLMCAGAIIQARVERVVFGAFDEKAGAVGSTANLLQSPLANHQCQVTAGVLGNECAGLLELFFARLRADNQDASSVGS